jgi:hypothetical protein
MSSAVTTFLRVTAVTAIALLIAAGARAEVVRIVVDSRSDLAGGMRFGSVGAYERITGTIYFAVDPSNPANQIITDIALAPRNADGKVEFSANFFLIKPKDVTRGNGTVLYEVSNRGGKGMLRYFNRGQGSNDPITEAHVGDGFLMEEGFTLLWLGWQFDPPLRDGLMRLTAPIATEDGRPIRGVVRSEIIVSEPTADRSLADRNHVPYEVADPTDPFNQMTVRDGVEGARRMIPRSQWRFAREENGAVVADRGRVRLEGGFQPHQIYEVVYVADNPTVVGLGPAAVRDAVSLLKNDGAEALGIVDGTIERALAFGISQSGRFLRTFLYYGFNKDEEDRPAFDGVISHVAGAGRGSFNHRFAQPSRDGHPFLNKFYPTDIFPFTDVAQADPLTGATGGLLAHLDPELTPKVFYTNSSYEYWGRAASLIHTSLDGRRDVDPPDNVRLYSFAGAQHGPGGFPPRPGSGQQPSNPNDYSWFMRSLLLAMNRWTTDDTPPPPSVYPRIDEGELVLPEDVGFPELPGVGQPATPHLAYRVSYGPEFETKGIVSLAPPEVGPAFPILVPAVDADGNEIGGLKMPEVAAPLATYTGWNLFRPEAGPPDVLSSMQGSYIAFPRTAADRRATGDPRASIEERYRSEQEYLERVSEAAQPLVRERYLLAGDLPRILEQARRHWSHAMGTEGGRNPSR